MLIRGYKPEAAPWNALAVFYQRILQGKRTISCKADTLRCAMGLGVVLA